jgi:hypothetical protein
LLSMRKPTDKESPKVPAKETGRQGDKNLGKPANKQAGEQRSGLGQVGG